MKCRCRRHVHGDTAENHGFIDMKIEPKDRPKLIAVVLLSTLLGLGVGAVLAMPRARVPQPEAPTVKPSLPLLRDGGRLMPDAGKPR